MVNTYNEKEKTKKKQTLVVLFIQMDCLVVIGLKNPLGKLLKVSQM